MSAPAHRPDEVLGEIKASLAHLEAEVAKLRDWRHAIADKIALLAHVPDLLLSMQGEIRGIREQIAALQREQARQDGARIAAEAARAEYERERERVGTWIRWGVPAIWAAIASLITWLTTHRIGGGQ